MTGVPRDERIASLVAAGYEPAAAEEQATRDEKIAAAVRAGGSLRAVGREYGITHERVRQIVKLVDPEATLAGQTVRAEAQVEAIAEAAPELIEKTCPICGTVFETTDPRRVTCSPEHADEWAAGARHRGSETHGDSVARYILRNPDKHSAAKVRWAERRAEERGLRKTG